MNNISWFTMFLPSVPECLIFYWLALQLFKINFSFSRLFYIAIIYGICSYFIRKFVPFFGIHTVIQTLFLVILFVAIIKISIYQSIIVSLSGAITAIIFEMLSTQTIINITGLALYDIISDPLLRVICPIPHMLIALIIVLILRKNNLYLIDLRR